MAPSASQEVAMDSVKCEEKRMGDDVKTPPAGTDRGEEKQMKSAIVKDMAIVCLAFFLNFTAFGGTATLQSSVNSEGNLGTKAFTALSVSGMISNLFLVTLVLSKLGLKWTLIVTLLLRTTYPAANLHSTWYTLYPTGIISGLAGAPLVTAFTAYLRLLSTQYAQVTRQPIEAATSKFFGLFFMIQRSSHLMSNFVSSQIFKRPHEAHPLPQHVIESICGANYCFEDFRGMFGRTKNSSSVDVDESTTEFTKETMMYRPSRHQIYLLFGIFVVCSLVSGPLLILIRPTKTKKSCNSKTSAKTWNDLLATFGHMTKMRSILLMPLSIYCGITLSFVLTSFSVGFITCSLGIDSIGYVMIVAGATGALSAVFICGMLSQYVGRKIIFTIAACGSFTAMAAMLNWTPGSEHSTTMLYTFAGIFGASNTIWLSQLSAFVGLVFAEDSGNAAYACHNLWQAVGLSIWQAVSVHLCIYVQIYVMATVLAAGLLGYAIIEAQLRRDERLKLEEVTTKL